MYSNRQHPPLVSSTCTTSTHATQMVVLFWWREERIWSLWSPIHVNRRVLLLWVRCFNECQREEEIRIRRKSKPSVGRGQTAHLFGDSTSIVAAAALSSSNKSFLCCCEYYKITHHHDGVCAMRCVYAQSSCFFPKDFSAVVRVFVCILCNTRGNKMLRHGPSISEVSSS